MPRSRCVLIAAVLLGLAACFALSAAASRSPRGPLASTPALSPKVKLAVLVVFDQMRGDYLDKWRPLFGRGGFARMQTNGAWFDHCYYPYATTTTGPGHASFLSGTCPDRHGIINNNWYDPHAADDSAELTGVYCAGSSRYEIVPAQKQKGKPKPVGNPERLLSETLADVLKRASNGQARVFGLSLKDRSAILPTGKRPDGAFWFENRFVTSTYYADRLPRWVEAFNASGEAERYFTQSWSFFRPDLDYEKYSGPDDAAGEGKGSGQGVTFPHPMSSGHSKPGAEFYKALANSPFGNDLLFDFAKTCIQAEGLGQHATPDLLVVSFSSNDLIGHTWGPDSQEVLDATLRSDALMAEFLKFLDQAVGVNQYAVVVTADHGICPLPEVSAAKGLDAKRVNPAVLIGGAANYLASAFGAARPMGGKAMAGLEAVSPPWLYLNPRFVSASGRTRAEVARGLADYLRRQPEIGRVYTRQELEGNIPASDEIGRLVKRSYHPDRSGDVYLLLKPYYLFSTGLISTGTTHGTPYEYDRHVPLLVYGPGVQGGRRPEPVAPQAAAAILAGFLGLPLPHDADFAIPKTLHSK